ncbi:flavin reductase family protein [Peribacillus sp. SCS-155]|uniref:flavin reductase family protein n=1 Tax=Peribacillus sedimenti TaxID=3115297 RepID=UPI003906656F
MDDRTFRNGMGKFATGITVLTTEIDGQVHGMTANAFMSVSLNPKLIVVSIDERAKMNQLISSSGQFAVSVLSESQKQMSMYFAGQFAGNHDVDFISFNGMPVLENALLHLTCTVYNKHVAGDHTLFIGEVTHLRTKEGTPLVYHEGKYKTTAELN